MNDDGDTIFTNKLLPGFGREGRIESRGLSLQIFRRYAETVPVDWGGQFNVYMAKQTEIEYTPAPIP